jgi:hypothetical protein
MVRPLLSLRSLLSGFGVATGTAALGVALPAGASPFGFEPANL